jgi:tetratricopeptide (TPR) repeat protein
LKRNRLIALITAAAILAVTVFTAILLRISVERRRVFHPAQRDADVPRELPAPEEWTTLLTRSSGDELIEILETIERQHPNLYERWSLAYLHGRALAELGEEREAPVKLRPFLAESHPWRDLALYHVASVSNEEEASRMRRTIIEQYPGSVHFDDAIDEEIEYLASLNEIAPAQALADQIMPAASTSRRRDIVARIVEQLIEHGRIDDAQSRGLQLLRGSTNDEAAGRVSRALDEADAHEGMPVEDLALLASSFSHHREYARAIDLMQRILRAGHSDERQFALGRSLYGKEDFEQARAVYERGAALTSNAEWKSTFLLHASRAAQLRGDDAAGERLMTAAIAVKGTFPATKAAVTQRIRLRLQQNRAQEAAGDLAFLRRIAGNERAYLDGALAYAVGMIARGNDDAALRALESVPRTLLQERDEAEFAYWRGRALERSDPVAALDAYLVPLRSEAVTQFTTFARERIAATPMRPALAAALRTRDDEVERLMAQEEWDLARRVQTDRLVLTIDDVDTQIERLTSIYRRLPEYRQVQELSLDSLPRFPIPGNDPSGLLMAMGLHDEALPAIEERYELRTMEGALNRAWAMYLAGELRASIHAVEVMMRSVPDGFRFELLPRIVQQLLYPQYFYPIIEARAQEHGADPRLLLSLMREESRFDPRARSQAAARGLLQFIITTARDIGRAIGLVELSPQDLYDPAVIIQLGAKYVGELSEEFEGDPYRIAASYNAGPKQAALWSRMQAAPGNDYFVTAINFDETKNYVHKVMGSYGRYAH